MELINVITFMWIQFGIPIVWSSQLSACGCQEKGVGGGVAQKGTAGWARLGGCSQTPPPPTIAPYTLYSNERAEDKKTGKLPKFGKRQVFYWPLSKSPWSI